MARGSHLEDLSLIYARPKNAVELKVAGTTFVLRAPYANNCLFWKVDSNADAFRRGGSCPTKYSDVALELHKSVVQLPPRLTFIVRPVFCHRLKHIFVSNLIRVEKGFYLGDPRIFYESFVLAFVFLFDVTDGPSNDRVNTATCV